MYASEAYRVYACLISLIKFKAYIKHTFLQACRRYVRPVILYAWGDIQELKCMLESIHFTFSKLGKIFTQTAALVVNFVNCCQLTTYNRSYKS